MMGVGRWAGEDWMYGTGLYIWDGEWCLVFLGWELGWLVDHGR